MTGLGKVYDMDNLHWAAMGGNDLRLSIWMALDGFDKHRASSVLHYLNLVSSSSLYLTE